MSHVLLKKWDEDPSFVDLQGNFRRISSQLVTGLEDSQRSFFMAALHNRTNTPSLVLASDMAKAEKIYEEVSAFLSPEDIYIFPAKDFFYAGEVLTQSKEILEQRIKVLERLSLGKKILVIAPVPAFLSKLVPPKTWTQKYIQVKLGAKIDWDYLNRNLIEIGYERADITESQGCFSVRGDIIDIFPFHADQPLRISFFDEEVESIRYFDPETQRSLESIEEFTIFPAEEIIIEDSLRQQGMKAISQELEKVTRKLKAKNQAEAADRIRTRTENHLLKLEDGGYFEEIDQYISYFYTQLASIADYFPENSLFFWDEPENVISLEQSLLKDLRGYQSSLLAQGDILPGQADLYWSLQEILENQRLRTIALSVFSHRVPYVKVDKIVNISSRSTPSFMGNIEVVREEVENFWKQGYEIFLMCDGEEKAAEMENLLRENDLQVSRIEQNSRALLDMKRNDVEMAVEGIGEVVDLEEERTKKEKKTARNIKIINGRVSNGFVLPSLNLVVLVDNDIIPRVKKKTRWSKKQKKDHEAITDFQELTPGDLVVHEQHGIGRYMGMRTLEVDGVKRDYLYIQYYGEDKLYLPVEQIDAIQKYVGGGEEKEPKIYSLGSQEWTRVKNRVKASVQELARELLSLYAARQAVEGYAFSPDHQWQKEFEDHFPYEETPDQLTAIEKVKEDMENPKPMDRLLCGDVGYGKTEVALRAAFKAVMDNKQVALLVPTTILAQQHYTTFLERFKEFPVNIELLSRFRTQKEQREVIKGIKAGVVDVVVGTHRLISKDVQFKDLGLIIVDEEHRFGVRHKEKLKMLRQQVDVLSMTATPIPRTLHMALSGARDLSVIDTPPEDRYPVQTYVVEYSEHMIKEAVQRELGRGGQVFFIYNRVQTINQFAEKIRSLFPEVRIVAAHGQMPEEKLEEVMNDFLEQEYDILISTTIVEAGLDIPNVNTMIVYDADTFGLAQLYQLRGRVGRSSRIAYCYLTYRKDKIITEEATKRLKAIKEFTELGSGFKIALRDLKIRGAGNILGPEQHGFMVAVGYELYSRLLQQAMESIQSGEEFQETRVEPKIDLNVNAYLPPSYVPNQQQKIELYRRIATLESEEELNDMAEELKDRFGRMQSPVENLLLVMRLRQLAREKNIESIEEQKGQVVMKFQQEKEFQTEKLWQLVHSYRKNVSLHAGKTSVSIKVKDLREQKEEERLKFLIDILKKVS